MKDPTADLIFEYLKSQAQFAYFQLGLAASAIAYAIHETKGQSLTETPWPFGAAVACWAISFAGGAFGIESRLRGIQSNARFLQARAGLKGIDSYDAEAHAMVQDGLARVEADVNRPVLRFQIQRWSLLLGAIFYVIGHILEMSSVS